ncbi:dienelactone hydrolase family protein [Pseudonocardia benzenivorans]|jgi:carboxymethylenebutenolidase|uniref:Dienelactone hydrolase n=2 Tax=Pseudonocardia TaxID=1847 RepID=F4CQC7_PSEUX|nr:dienelactone hydrolase family protein [Pseudonocardia dioxanivorans]AEA28400.1 dienelactone hydrolase [Pseudonocardia dioxanivorans CB1190]GJF02497.1 hydrolase [Pseudonocardia sp. D17]
MPRLDVTIPTADGEAAATLHLPEGDGPWPGVVMFPDAGGARPTFSGMGDRLASLGYATLVPDVYYRNAGYAPFDLATVFGDAEERARLFELMGTLDNERIVADASAYLDFLLARPEVTGDGAGTTGYCMGGRISMLVAGSLPEKVAAAASFHGGRLAPADDPTSPHLLAGNVRAKVYVAGAQDDASFPQEQFDRLDAALTEAGVEHTIETYPAGHGFAVPDNATYDKDAEERHWAALDALYSSALSR